MKAHTHYLWFTTKQRQEIIDITEQVAEQVQESGVAEGLALVSAMHITASVFVNDHEAGLWADILKWLETTIAPWDPKRYRHNETGEDNAAAHLRSLTIGHEVIVPITGGRLDLGPHEPRLAHPLSAPLTGSVGEGVPCHHQPALILTDPEHRLIVAFSLL